MDKNTAPNEWEQAFDALPDLIMILDHDYRIVKANRAMAKKLGCAPKDLFGHTFYKSYTAPMDRRSGVLIPS